MPDLNTTYLSNSKRSKKLCKELEVLITLRKKSASKEALELYSVLNNQIQIINNQLDVIWDEQIEIQNLLNQHG